MGFLHQSRSFLLPLTVLLSGLCFSVSASNSPGYPQYTEAACILISEQMERFKRDPHLPSYQNAARNYSRHCQNPTAYAPPPKVRIQTSTPVVTQTTPEEPALVQQLPRAADPVMVKPQPVANEASGASNLLLWPLLLMVLVLMFRVWQRSFASLTANEILGRQAEQQLAKYLVDGLPDGFKHYRNIIVTTEFGDLTEVDHLIVCPYGIFVIEVKNFKGWIFGGEKHKHWVVQQFRRKHQFLNPLSQNFKHTEAVAHLLEIDTKTDSGKIHSLVAFSARAEFKTRMPDNVMYIEQVLRYIEGICEHGRTIGDEVLLKYIARLNLVADRADALRPEHLLQQEGHQLLRDLNGLSR